MEGQSERDWMKEFDMWTSNQTTTIASEPELSYTISERYVSNPIVKLSFEFALATMDYTEVLTGLKKFVVAQQLLKCGTSIGANIREAQNAESRADFVHKMKIALKEADETSYWLLLCKASPHYPDCQPLLTKLDPVIRILNKIVSTSKKLP
jgi:four helix bundle protein